MEEDELTIFIERAQTKILPHPYPLHCLCRNVFVQAGTEREGKGEEEILVIGHWLLFGYCLPRTGLVRGCLVIGYFLKRILSHLDRVICNFPSQRHRIDRSEPAQLLEAGQQRSERIPFCNG